MAFGEVATTGQVEKFRGFYTCDGLTVQPMRFYVCDLHTYGLDDLTAFEQSYKLGSAVHYEVRQHFLTWIVCWLMWEVKGGSGTGAKSVMIL